MYSCCSWSTETQAPWISESTNKSTMMPTWEYRTSTLSSDTSKTTTRWDLFLHVPLQWEKYCLITTFYLNVFKDSIVYVCDCIKCQTAAGLCTHKVMILVSWGLNLSADVAEIVGSWAPYFYLHRRDSITSSLFKRLIRIIMWRQPVRDV